MFNDRTIRTDCLGGSQVDAKKYKIEKEYALVLMPARLRVELPCPELPELVLSAITAVQVGAGDGSLCFGSTAPDSLESCFGPAGELCRAGARLVHPDICGLVA